MNDTALDMTLERWAGFQQVLFRERGHLSDRSNEGKGQSEGEQNMHRENNFAALSS